MYKYSHDLLPVVFDDLYNNNASVHNRLTRTANLLRIPKCKLNTCKFSLHYLGCVIWNNLGQDFKTSPSIISFKKCYKLVLSKE